MTQPEIDKFRLSLFKSTWVKARYNLRPGGGRYETDWQHIPVNERRKHVLLREVAYWITPRTAAFHGREFCEIYLTLVQHFMGVEAAKALKEAFKANKVKFRPARQMSDEARAAAGERLMAARVRKAGAEALALLQSMD